MAENQSTASNDDLEGDGIINLSDEPNSVTEEAFFSLIVSAGAVGHILHLQSTSFAAHKALQKFYEDVVEIADAVIETYQGWKKEIVQYDCEILGAGADETPLDYLGAFREIVEEHRYEFIPKEQTHIHNELDNLVALVDSTVYKLTFLK